MHSVDSAATRESNGGINYTFACNGRQKNERKNAGSEIKVREV